MRHTATAATLLTCLTVVTGCSGPGPEGTADTRGLTAIGVGTGLGAPAGPSPLAGPPPLAGLSALQVWEKTKADADATSSVHVAARFLDGERLNLKLTSAGKVFGVLTLRGDRILVRRLGRVLYLKAGRRFWTRTTDATTARNLTNSWVTVRKGSSRDLEQLFQLTDMDYIVSDIMSLSVAEQESLTLVPGIDIGQEKTIGLRQTGTGEAEEQTLYVSAGDPALPLNLSFGSDGRQFMKFRGWNEDFTVIAPRGAVSLTTAR